ncbi:unnamed protein product [Brassica oleracea var. botrytis]
MKSSVGNKLFSCILIGPEIYFIYNSFGSFGGDIFFTKKKDQSRDGSGQNNEAEALDDKGEEILGSFENAEMRCSDGERAKGDKVKRYYELTFKKKLREKVMGPYLRHVVAISEESKKSLRVVIIAKVWRRATDALVALV